MDSIGCFGKDKNLEFIGRYLKVRDSHTSDDIIWDNLSYSKISKFFRRLVSFLATFFVFVICKKFINIIDLIQNSLYLVYSFLIAIRFYKYVNEQYGIGVYSNFLFLIAIFIVDKILKLVNKKLTKFEKKRTHSSESETLIFKLFAIELLNIVN